MSYIHSMIHLYASNLHTSIKGLVENFDFRVLLVNTESTFVQVPLNRTQNRMAPVLVSVHVSICHTSVLFDHELAKRVL